MQLLDRDVPPRSVTDEDDSAGGTCASTGPRRRRQPLHRAWGRHGEQADLPASGVPHLCRAGRVGVVAVATKRGLTHLEQWIPTIFAATDIVGFIAVAS